MYFLGGINLSIDIVRGRILKPQETKQLIEEIQKYSKEQNDNGTLYLGYPLTASKDKAVTIDALLVTENKGMIAFILGSNNKTEVQLKEEQDALYYHIDFYLKGYSTLRKGRNLALNPIVMTILPNKVEFDSEGYYFIVTNQIIEKINNLEKFNKLIYSRLCSIIQRVSEIKPTKPRNNVKLEDSYGAIIKAIEKEIANLDQWQKKAAYEIPNGPQRIRGLAGSGKTIVLALKAAYLHTQYPDMKIAVTYYTRSLYQQYVNLITDFIKEFTGETVNWDNLDIIHAWGSNSEKGIYSKVAENVNVVPYNLTSAINKFGRKDTFAKVCDELLGFIDESNYEPNYDVILIDEAQDMPSSFFRLVYNDVKEPKKIVWAYDELQNLSVTEMPSLEEMFGTDKDGNLRINIENVEDEAKRDIILPLCYRNPPWTLALAHSLGFGLYHKPIIQMFDSLDLWRDIGYTVKTGRLKYNNTVTLTRKTSATPEYFEKLLNPKDSVLFEKFPSKEKQYLWVVEQIYKNITEDELDPDDILVIFPDAYYSKADYKEFQKYLNLKSIDSVLAGVTTDRDIFREKGSITCSHIYRAKGNEAPMVYVLNSDYCAEDMELSMLRNILFTAITRSRAWVRICGVGSKMTVICNEIKACVNNNYELKFKIPSKAEMEHMKKINRERTSEEKEKVVKAKSSINELIEQIEKGEVDIELIPEINSLLNVINKKK